MVGGITDHQIPNGQNVSAGFTLWDESSMKGAVIVFVRRFDPHHVRNRLLLRMRHRHLGRMMFHLLRQLRQPFDLRLLPLIILFLLLIILPLLPHEIRVVAGIALCRSMLDLIHRTHDPIQKHAIMTHDDKRIRIVLQEPFQPLDRSDIQMVRRFVEQKYFGLGEQQFDKGKFRPLSAGECGKPLVLIFLRKPETPQHGVIFFFVIVAADVLKRLLQRRIFLDQRSMRRFVCNRLGHFPHQRVQTLLHGKHAREHLADFFIQRQFFVGERNLL